MSSDQFGHMVCQNTGCPMVGVATTYSTCVRCHQLTQRRERPAEVAPTPGPQPLSLTAKATTGMEIGSRVLFGGFWTVVTIVAGFGGLALLASGEPTGLLALIAAALTGIYARYIFKGGRWRFLFW